MINSINKSFWKDKKVLVTGHTGFKGAWLCMLLNELGAKIYGYSLPPSTEPSLFELCKLDKYVNTLIGDIRDSKKLSCFINESEPDIVIHMAAQALVREGYNNPVETYEINIMGTVNLFEAIRNSSSVKAIVNVTTDKCYENKEWYWAYRENEPLGGYDPYSSSKACSELVTSAFRSSFFNPDNYNKHRVAIASARAGNVIGGGDWAKDRLIPDCIKAILEEKKVLLRNPNAVRPWQHVLEPLTGYLLLAEKLYTEGVKYGDGWNFGPHENDAKTVKEIVELLCKYYGKGASYRVDDSNHPHEARYLKLDCSKAKNELGWIPKWDIDVTIEKIVLWMKAYSENINLLSTCKQQIKEYLDQN